jgi:hypothetical protein
MMLGPIIFCTVVHGVGHIKDVNTHRARARCFCASRRMLPASSHPARPTPQGVHQVLHLLHRQLPASHRSHCFSCAETQRAFSVSRQRRLRRAMPRFRGS